MMERLNTLYPELMTQLYNMVDYFFSIDLNISIINSIFLSIHTHVFLNYWAWLGFFYGLFLMIFYSILVDYFKSKFYNYNFISFYKNFINLWVSFTGIKFESFEETFCVIVLWPWCIFLVFTHVFFLENNEVFFVFMEWGLPVIIGFMIILESLWVFGCHIFIYLTGSRGRRFFFIVIIEDLVAFSILLSRVTLQIVRGIICAFYHDFFRDIFELITYLWDDIFVFSDIGLFEEGLLLRFLIFFVDIYFMSMMLFFVYFILFLQLLFLLIAVWLFCRCWFISSRYLEIIRSRGWDNVRVENKFYD